jgi:uncharacterized SAM-binding protein YcdF (DUF218 family)
MTENLTKNPPFKKRSWPWLGLRICVYGLGVLLLAALGCQLFPRAVLTMESGPVKADVMVVLGGGYRERAERAAELFKQGEAPKIIVSGTGDCDFNRQLLATNGVPAAAIVLECNSRTTLENAKFSVPILRRLGAKRVIIVTSWYHSRRALACFEHFAPEIKFYSRPSYAGYVEDEWARRYVNGFAKTEYVKLLGYWGRYGVCPF